MKYLSTAVCAAAVLAAGSAFAGDNPAWTWGQGQFTSMSSGDDSSDELGLTGSIGIADLFHVQASYLNGTSGITGGPDQDYDGWRLVGGVHPHIGANTDAVFNLRYTSYNLDDTSNDVDAWGVGAGLRHMLTDKVELNGMINWDRADVDHVSNGKSTNVSWEVGGRYLVTPEFSAGVTYNDSGSVYYGGGSMTLDLRYQFRDIL